MEQTKSKKFIISILILVLLSIGVFFLFRSGTVSLGGEFSEQNIAKVIDSQIVLDVTQVDSDFKIAPNTGLLLEEDVEMDESFRSQILSRISEYENKRDALTEESEMSDFVGTYFTLAADYKNIGQYGKSKEAIEKIIERDPKNSNIIQFYSFLLASMGRKDLAVYYINKAITLLPSEPSYWLWKINLEKERGVSIDKLDSLYKLSISSAPQNPNLHVLYAQFLSENGKKDEAILNWEEARRMDAQNRDAYQAEINKLKE